MSTDTTGFSAVDYASAADDPNVTADQILDTLSSSERRRIDEVEARLDEVTETVTVHKPHGQYTAERLAMHAAIIENILSQAVMDRATPPPGERPTLIFLGGRGGSGKSRLKGLAYDPERFLVIDPDAIKALLPEYAGWNAFEVHEESSDIAEALLRMARGLRLNVVLDVTLKSRAPALSKAQVFIRDDYRVEVHYMFLPRQIAARRAINRFFGKQGRYVPVDVILGNTTNEETFDSLRQMADAWSFYDNSGSEDEHPVRIAAFP